MKKVLPILLALGFLFPIIPTIAFAACSPVALGGTGWCNLASTFLLYGNGTSPIATSSNLFWTDSVSRLSFTNGSSTNQNISNILWLTALGTPAGTVLAVDPDGKVIATTTAGGSGSVTSVATAWPVTGGPITTTGTINWDGIATSSIPSGGELAAWNSSKLLYGAATSTLFGTGTGGQVLTWVAGVPAWNATSTTQYPLAFATSTGAYTCPTCSTTTGTVTSIIAGLGLNGGTITTSGTIFLKSYLATSSAETGGQLAAWGSTNGTPALLYSIATSSQTLSAAFSTSGTLGTFVGGSSGTLSNIVEHSFTYSTSTAWTGTTTIPLYQATVASTINGTRCKVYQAGNVPGGTLNAQIGKYTASTTMFNASSTNNFMAQTTNNTVSAGDSWYIDIGTPASTPVKINCTFKTTV